MVDTNTRQGKRTPVTLKIKFKSETIEQFIERYAVDVSQGGIFIRTKEPLAVGTQMRFEFQLRDASPLIGGEGTVVWTRENDPSRPAIAPGMGVRFDRLAEGSQSVLERILAEKAKQAPQRQQAETTKPPMFTDTPTRVAPAPVQEALLGEDAPSRGPRRRGDSFNDSQTPLPKPMPFHSDADEFPEEAFEEATKVRALDELIAQTAGDSAATAAAKDELAERRAAAEKVKPAPAPAEAKAATPPVPEDRDSAPTLPSPPEAAGPRLLDTTPSPASAPVEKPADAPAAKADKTDQDDKAAKADAKQADKAEAPSKKSEPKLAPRDGSTRPSAAGEKRAISTPAPLPATKSSAAPIVILVIVLLAAAAAGVWFFFLRKKVSDNQQKPTTAQLAGSDQGALGSAGSATDPGPGPGPGPGSGDPAGTGPGSAVDEPPPPPAGPLVDTVITASVDKALIEVIGGPIADQAGPAPYTAQLEKDKPYQVRVSAPGFVAQEVEVKGGQSKLTVKLVAKPRVISVASDPPGALIFIDGTVTGQITPRDVELTKAQAARKSVQVTIRKQGFKTVTKVIGGDAYTEADDKLTTAIEEKLVVQQVVRPPPERPTPPDPTPEGGTPPPEGGTPPTPTPTPTPTPPAEGGGASTPPPAPAPPSTEPQPDFIKSN